jgi:PKD repeat protein
MYVFILVFPYLASQRVLAFSMGPNQACPAYRLSISVYTSQPVYSVGQEIVAIWSPQYSGKSGEIILNGPSGTYQYNVNDMGSGSADLGTTQDNDVGYWHIQIYVGYMQGCGYMGSASNSFQVVGSQTVQTCQYGGTYPYCNNQPTQSSRLQISISCGPSTGNAPLTVGCRGNPSGGSPPYSYYWNFGDGTTSSDAYPSHTYNNPGNYQISLTLTDSSGASTSQSVTIQVTQSTVTVTFYVQVTDSYTGSPIQGASVSIDGQVAGVTDSNGKASLSTTVPPYVHYYSVDADGYTSAQGPWSFGTNSGGTFSVKMSRAQTSASASFDSGNGGAQWQSPVYAGQSFEVTFTDERLNPLTDQVQIQSSSPNRGWFQGGYFHAPTLTFEQCSIVASLEPGQCLSYSLSIYVDTDTPSGSYTINLRVCYNSCPWIDDFTTYPPDIVVIMVTVVGSQSQEIAPVLAAYSVSDKGLGDPLTNGLSLNCLSVYPFGNRDNETRYEVPIE